MERRGNEVARFMFIFPLQSVCHLKSVNSPRAKKSERNSQRVYFVAFRGFHDRFLKYGEWQVYSCLCFFVFFWWLLWFLKLDVCWAATNHRQTVEIFEENFLHGNAPTHEVDAYHDSSASQRISLVCHSHTFTIKILPSSHRFWNDYLTVEIFRKRNKHFYEHKYLFKWHEIKSFMAAALLCLSNDLIFN